MTDPQPDPQTRARIPWQLALTVYGVLSVCVILTVVVLGGSWLLDGESTVFAILVVIPALLVLIAAAGWVGARLMRRWYGPSWGGRDAA